MSRSVGTGVHAVHELECAVEVAGEHLVPHRRPVSEGRRLIGLEVDGSGRDDVDVLVTDIERRAAKPEQQTELFD